MNLKNQVAVTEKETDVTKELADREAEILHNLRNPLTDTDRNHTKR